MTQPLEEIFRDLGISQYLEVFVDQGFDTWETILDITESDLDALGVKLGHRRKLQRRIANSRGLAPDAALVSPTRQSIEEQRLDGNRPETSQHENRADQNMAAVAKRKYRRHPKPDENAPERPPSAYVLFSNKMREDLKGRNLTFTEIAKLVGENWQNLSQGEKEPFESQAQAAKDKYNQDLTEYKKTAAYRQYQTYLQEFKAKHSNQSQEKDVSKRVKLSDAGTGSSSTMRNGVAPRNRSGTGSGSEPPPGREQRLGSAVSTGESLYSNCGHPPHDEASSTPVVNHLDYPSDRSSTPNTSPRDTGRSHASSLTSNWLDSQRSEPPVNQRALPPLSDVLDSRAVISGIPNGDGMGYPFPRTASTDSPGPAPSMVGSESRPPSLRKEYSSAGSSVSSFSYPRTPVDGSLPIHALLSGKPAMPYEHSQSIPLPAKRSRSPSSGFRQDRSTSDPSVNGASGANGVLTNGHSFFTSPPPLAGNPTVPPGTQAPNHLPRPRLAPGSATNGTDGSSFDGMSALLRAGEIVNRQTR